MKKLFFVLLSFQFLLACNNSETTTTSADSSAPVTPGIDNVNGVIPDTNSAIQLNEPLPKDSSGINDTTRQ
jgi:hypothetical protein